MISLNMGYQSDFSEGLIQYLSEEFSNQEQPVTYRYVGSMVADIHRNLLKGGIRPPLQNRKGNCACCMNAIRWHLL